MCLRFTRFYSGVGNAEAPECDQVFALLPVVGLYIIMNRCNSLTPSLTPTILCGASLYSIMLPLF